MIWRYFERLLLATLRSNLPDNFRAKTQVYSNNQKFNSLRIQMMKMEDAVAPLLQIRVPYSLVWKK